MFGFSAGTGRVTFGSKAAKCKQLWIQRVKINLNMCKQRALAFFKVFSSKIKNEKSRGCMRGRYQKWNKYVLA